MNRAQPDPRSETADRRASETDAGESDLHFLLARQRDRAIAISAAGLATVVAHAAGLIPFDWVLGIAVLALGWASVLGFDVFYLQGARQGRALSRQPWWLVADVLFVSALISISGGIASPWVAGYVACAGSAARLRGRRTAVLVAVASALAYLCGLAAEGQIHGLDSALMRASFQLAVVFGSAAALVGGAARLRESRETIRRHEEASRLQCAELGQAASDLEATADVPGDLRLDDALTGARNRRYLSELSGVAGAAGAAIERRARFDMKEPTPRRGGEGVGVLMVDVDGFKHINEAFGHPVGDRILVHAAAVLRRYLRPDDTLVRWGGDEFLILLAGADPGHTGEVADRVAQALSCELCEIRPQECLALSCSAGWSHVDWQGSDREPLESAVAAAHAALYRAKREQPGNAVASHCRVEIPAEMGMAMSA